MTLAKLRFREVVTNTAGPGETHIFPLADSEPVGGGGGSKYSPLCKGPNEGHNWPKPGKDFPSKIVLQAGSGEGLGPGGGTPPLTPYIPPKPGGGGGKASPSIDLE